MTIGERIKISRDRAGITQVELGEKIGVSGVAIMRYEKNTRQPRLEQLQAIAAALNVSVNYLLYGHTVRAWIKEWKSDKSARLYMRIDSSLLDALEGYAELDNVPLDDMIEEILHCDVEKRDEDQANEELARKMQEWHERHITAAPSEAPPESAPAPPEPREGKDTTPAEKPTEGPPEGE